MVKQALYQPPSGRDRSVTWDAAGEGDADFCMVLVQRSFATPCAAALFVWRRSASLLAVVE
ncbi:hypothetical protein [Rhodopila sp.]|uniref:hypothetical protein n=1 Tax=Rhodopila sp. TaxID=2480087 RepID=UPI003D13D38D